MESRIPWKMRKTIHINAVTSFHPQNGKHNVNCARSNVPFAKNSSKLHKILVALINGWIVEIELPNIERESAAGSSSWKKRNKRAIATTNTIYIFVPLTNESQHTLWLHSTTVYTSQIHQRWREQALMNAETIHRMKQEHGRSLCLFYMRFKIQFDVLHKFW